MSAADGILRLPDHVQFGRGAIAGLAPAVAGLGDRAFVIVDPFLATTPAFENAMDAVRAAGVAVTVHSEVVPELPVADIEATAQAARAAGPSVVVGYGGGSALDLAKVVALLLSHPGPLSAYYGENAVPGPVLPLVAVPTTAGTGSEVTPVAVVTDPDRELKVGISSAAIVPRVAIVDPALSAGAPAAVTAYSGIDALVHAIEARTAAERAPDWDAPLPVFVGRNRLSSLLAIEAIGAIGGALPRAVADGDDVAARDEMAWGSMVAGMAFGSAGTHLSHALQYPIGALTKTPHGLGTGLMLPYVLRECLPHCRDALAGVGVALGAPDPSTAAEYAIEAVTAINDAIGIPRSLEGIGVERSDLHRIAELASGVRRLVENAPMPVDTAVLLRILEAAYDG